MNTKYYLKSIVACLAIVTAVVASSCSGNKQIVYVQGADTLYAVPQQIEQAFELKIESDDELAISVTSKARELIEPFNNNTLIGSGQSGLSGSNTSTTQSGVCYFLVDKQGNIEFPVFGTVKALGKSTKELAKELQDRMRNEGHIQDAIVNVKVMSFKVTVLGDVKNPGLQSHTGERLTLLEALGRAGDMNPSAKRNHVLVIREENGRRVTYDVDTRSSESVFRSPAYYLQQNDVVYVQPNKSVRVKGSAGYLWLSIGSTLLGMLTSIVSLVLAITLRK